MSFHINDNLPSETGMLIDFIIGRYHAAHREDLTKLQILAGHAARIHMHDPVFPRGLVWALGELAQEMENHMAKEEYLLFPLMRVGATLGTTPAIRSMRADHQTHSEYTDLIMRLTHELTPPSHASDAWRTLYTEIHRFLLNLADHMAVENDILFPRFEQSQGRAQC